MPLRLRFTWEVKMAAIAIDVWEGKAIIRSRHRWGPIQVLLLALDWSSGLLGTSSCYLIFHLSLLLNAVLLDTPRLVLLLLTLGGVHLVEKLAQLGLRLWVVDHCLLFLLALILDFIVAHLLLLLGRVQRVHSRVIQNMLLEADSPVTSWGRCRWYVQWRWCRPCELGSGYFRHFDGLRVLCHALAELRMHRKNVKIALGAAYTFEVTLWVLPVILHSKPVCLQVLIFVEGLPLLWWLLLAIPRRQHNVV